MIPFDKFYIHPVLLISAGMVAGVAIGVGIIIWIINDPKVWFRR